MQLKDLSEWDLDYLRARAAAEFDWIDFKSSAFADFTPKELGDLSRYCSAFANYDGGYLIIGIRERKKEGVFELDEGVDFNAKNGIKAWLEDMLPTLTERPLSRFNVAEIPYPNIPRRMGQTRIIIRASA